MRLSKKDSLICHRESKKHTIICLSPKKIENYLIMKTALEVGNRLQEARREKHKKLVDLVDSTGLTAVTLRNVLEGKTDARVSTIIAIAQEVGLELVLVPTQIANSIESSSAKPVAIESLVDRALRSQFSTVEVDSAGYVIEKRVDKFPPPPKAKS
jgi:transcriptional regulator with XRE-family HTH domain